MWADTELSRLHIKIGGHFMRPPFSLNHDSGGMLPPRIKPQRPAKQRIDL